VVALPHLPHATAAAPFAYVASGQGSLQVFALRGEAWTRIQNLPSRAPACILLSPSQRTLYVANEVNEHEGLPRGTVEAFRIDPVDGCLTLLGRRPLSLSATRPRHMALSPDGKLLAVAAYGGGLYNLLPVAEDGSLGEPASIFKDAGSGPQPQLQASAHPHTLIFDATGRHLLSSDFGSDRLSVFAVENGRLIRRMQRSTGEGSGPGACALHPCGSFLYALHDLERTINCYQYDGTIGDSIQQLALEEPTHAIGLHPSGRMLYTTQGNTLRVWHVDENGRLASAQQLSFADAKPTHITVATNGGTLFILDDARGSIYKFNADHITGELHSKSKVAEVNEPTSMVLKTLS